jgi:hypothetical protein
MNKIFYTLIFATSLFIFSCGQGNNTASEDSADTLTADVQCYTAIFESDTANLEVITASDGKVTGDLTISFGEVQPNSLEKMVNVGQIAGSFKGDTLFVDYSYRSGTINNEIFKNPMAFLKSGDNLILGVGDIETYLGRSYFVKDKPIDFERSRFTFEPVECEE